MAVVPNVFFKLKNHTPWVNNSTLLVNANRFRKFGHEERHKNEGSRCHVLDKCALCAGDSGRFRQGPVRFWGLPMHEQLCSIGQVWNGCWKWARGRNVECCGIRRVSRKYVLRRVYFDSSGPAHRIFGIDGKRTRPRLSSMRDMFP